MRSPVHYWLWGLPILCMVVVGVVVTKRPPVNVASPHGAISVDAGTYPDQRYGQPATIQRLSVELQKHPSIAIFKIAWHVRSGIQLFKPETHQIVYDRRSRKLEYQLVPDKTFEWWGWTDVSEESINSVSQMSGTFKDLEDRGCKFVPYKGPLF